MKKRKERIKKNDKKKKRKKERKERRKERTKCHTWENVKNLSIISKVNMANNEKYNQLDLYKNWLNLKIFSSSNVFF